MDEYTKARQQAVNWLKKDPHRRDFNEGLDILTRMNFQALTVKSLRMRGDTPAARRILNERMHTAVAVRHPAPLTEHPSLPSLGEGQGVGSPSSLGEGSAADSPLPPTVERVTILYADVYKRRDILHRQLRNVGDRNDQTSIERRKILQEDITRLSDLMDALFPLKDAYYTTGTIPTDEQIEQAINTHSSSLKPIPSGGEGGRLTQSSLRKKEEDFSDMSRQQLQKRRHNIKTQLTKKENLLRYQVERKAKKENPMPPCPKREKIAAQITMLKEKLYLIEIAIAKLG